MCYLALAFYKPHVHIWKNILTEKNTLFYVSLVSPLIISLLTFSGLSIYKEFKFKGLKFYI